MCVKQNIKLNNKEKGLIDDKFEHILKEFKSSLSVFYIVLVGIGMLFSYSKYKQFGINIFQYSEIFDFLITPFRDLTVLVVTLFSIILVFLIYKIDRLTKHFFPKFYNSKFNFGLMKSNPIIAITTSILLYLVVFSEAYGKYNKKHFANTVKKVSVKLITGEVKTGKLIGKNNGYIFLMENSKVKIIPITTSIKEIIIQK